MSEVWGSIYYEILSQIRQLTAGDIHSMSVRDPNNIDGTTRITRFDNFLNQRYSRESLTSLSEAEWRSLEEAYQTRVIELTNGQLDSTGRAVIYSLS